MPNIKINEQILKRSLYSSDGKLYSTIGEKRYLFAECKDIKIDLMENVEKIKTGGSITNIVSYYFSIIFCDNMTMRLDYDLSLLEEIRFYDFYVKIQREDGIIEELIINNLIPQTIDLTEDIWEFRAELTKEMAAKLRTI